MLDAEWVCGGMVVIITCKVGYDDEHSLLIEYHTTNVPSRNTIEHQRNTVHET